MRDSGWDIIPPDVRYAGRPCRKRAHLGSQMRKPLTENHHVRSDTWPHQPAAANAQIPLANGEPSIHGRLLTSLGRYSFPKADVEHTNSHDRNLSSPSCANTLEPTWFDPRLDALGRTRAEPPSNYPVPSHTFSWVSVKSATASTKCLRRLQVLLLRTTPRTCHRDATPIE